VLFFLLFSILPSPDIAPYDVQARIALLEGERRSFENIKLDLMRRIRMLEYALRMERSVLPSQLKLTHVNDMTHAGRSSSHSRLRSQCQSQSFIPTPRHPLKRTKRKRVAVVPHEARVRLPATLPAVCRY
jgi:hypothetical protein